MGNQNKATSQNNKSSAEKAFNKHQMFIDSKVVQDKNQNCFYQVSHSVANKNLYKNWMTQVQNFQKQIQNNQRFLLLPLESSYTQEGMCGSAGILKIKFDYYPFTLGQQISNRHNLDQPFDEKQIWYLLFVLIQSAYQFHCRNKIIGDIKPENVFVNQNGDVALYSLLTLPDIQSNYFKTFIHKQITYIPPEAITDIQNGKQSPTYNQSLGQSFSIGLTLLDAVLLYNSNELYYKAFLFNEGKLRQLLKEFHGLGLSEQLATIIDGLLRFNIQQRLKTSEVFQYLKQYEQLICNLQQFQPGPLPLSIQQKLKLRNKKPSSRIINLANNSHHSSPNKQKSTVFLQTTQFPVYVQNINQFQNSRNVIKPQKVYSFMDPSQQNNNFTNGQISQTNVNNLALNTKYQNSKRNSNQNIFMSQSNVNRIVENKKYQLEYPSNNLVYHQNYQSNNNFNGMKLKHAESKDQKYIELKSNIDGQNQQKLKSNFLNDYAKQSQKLLQQYEKITYSEVNKPNYTTYQPPYSNLEKISLYKNQNVENHLYSNKFQISSGAYSFGTGHLSNNLTNMGRITTSITPNNYSIYQQSSKQIKPNIQAQVQNFNYKSNLNKYSNQNKQGEKSQNRYNQFQKNSYNYKIENYPVKTNSDFSIQDKNQLSFATGHRKQLQIVQRDAALSYKPLSYGNYKVQNTQNHRQNYMNNNYGDKKQKNSQSYSKNTNNANQNYYSNYSNQYNNIFSAIDKQLQESRKMYPGS